MATIRPWDLQWFCNLFGDGWVNALDHWRHDLERGDVLLLYVQGVSTGQGPLIYRTETDLEKLILKISGMVAYLIMVTLSGKGVANFISSRQWPCLFLLNE